MSCGVGQRLSGVLIRGELAIGAQLRATKLVYGRSVWILTMMQSCGSDGCAEHSLNGDHCGVIEQPGLELSLRARWAQR